MNLYAYAGNNPIAFSDPFGLCDPTKLACKLAVKIVQSLAGGKLNPREANWAADHPALAALAWGVRGDATAIAKNITKNFITNEKASDVENAARHLVGSCTLATLTNRETATKITEEHEQNNDSDPKDSEADRFQNENGFRAAERGQNCVDAAKEILGRGDWKRQDGTYVGYGGTGEYRQ